ncbi:APC family permease [Pseudonocardia endophytica]|uniref:APC family permease n=1 Tax=Pseudonocardia endophytica TaxID=401976 RepID=UPI00140552A8|nr:APC family permease [Pseudonocardia endophytica]
MTADTTTEPAGLDGHLGTPALLLLTLSYMAPLVAMGGYVPVIIGYGLGAATPVVYAGVMAVMLVFAVGLMAMARHMTTPGAFYTYITAGLGRVAGLGAGFAALTGYVVTGAATYGLGGIVTGELVQGLFHGPSLPWWFWAIVLWAVVSTLTMFNIAVSARVLTICLAAEIAIVLLWDAQVLTHGGPAGYGLDLTAQLGTGSVGFALLFGIACLTGFESIQVFRAETREPNRTIPRATYLTVVILTGFWALGSYAYLVAYGTDAAIATAATPAESFLASLAQYAGTAVRDVANVLLVTSVVAAMLAVQNICARYSFALGRDHVLPPWLGVAHPRYKAPTRAAVVVALVIVVIIAVPALLRIDSTVAYVALQGIGLWVILVLMLATSVAITVFFRRNPDTELGVWRTTVAPMLAILGLGYAVLQATVNSDVMVGGSGVVAAWCIAAVVVVAAAGMVYATWLRTRRPQIWTRIGGVHGADVGPAPSVEPGTT